MTTIGLNNHWLQCSRLWIWSSAWVYKGHNYSWETHLSVICHSTSERAPPQPQPDRLVLDLHTPERKKAALTSWCWLYTEMVHLYANSRLSRQDTKLLIATQITRSGLEPSGFYPLYLARAACAQWKIGEENFDKVVDQNFPIFFTEQTTPLTKLSP